MSKKGSSNIKNPKKYEELRDHGMSKEKAARIANSDSCKTSRKGGKAKQYEEWSKDELYEKAKKVGIQGRSHMTKKQLINRLRNH